MRLIRNWLPVMMLAMCLQVIISLGSRGALAQATAYTLTGPATITNASAYTYSVTPTGGTYTGTITPFVSGVAGTLNPTTLTYSASSATQTFTFTPSATGTATMSATNSGALTNPSNLTITVNSATGFAISNAAFVLTAPSFTDSTFLTHSARQVSTQSAEYDFKFSGAGLDMQLYSQGGANPITISIDGGATTTPTIPTTTWGTYTLVSGLSDTLHTCQIKMISIQTIYWDRNTFIAVTGASPSVSSPDGFGVIQSISALPGSYRADETGSAANIHSWLVTQWVNNDGSLIIRDNCTSLQCWMYTSSCVAVSIDGGLETSYAAPASPTGWQWITIATGLPAGTHTFALSNASPAGAAGYGNQGNVYLWGFNSVGGTGIVSTTAFPARPVWIYFGDSITATRTTVPIDGGGINFGFAHNTSFSGNAQGVNKGWGGSFVSGAASGNGQGRTADITTYSPSPQVCLIEYGTNDCSNAVAVGTFQTAYIAMLTKLVQGLPNCKFYALHIIPRQSVSISAIQQFNNAIDASVAAVASPNVQIIDCGAWLLSGTNGQDWSTNYRDGIHPNKAGYAIINKYVTPVMTAPPVLRGRSTSRARA